MEDTFTLEMTLGAEILHFGVQNGGTNIWVLVDPDISEREIRRFRLAGTGHPIEPDPGWVTAYIGTVSLLEDILVLHLFEVFQYLQEDLVETPIVG